MLNLMSSGEIGSLKLKNRIVMAPMGPHFGDIDRKAVEYFSARARGGDHSVSEAFCKYPLAVLLHAADLEATYLDEKSS